LGGIISAPVPQTQNIPQVRIKKTIIAIDQDTVNKYLLKLREAIYSRTEYEKGSIFGKLQEVLQELDDLVNKLMLMNTEFLSVIVPPNTGELAYKKKILTAIENAELLLREAVGELNQQIDIALSSRDEKQINILLNKFEEFFKLVFMIHLAILIIEERVLNILAINAPSDQRPPLANMVIAGYEQVRG